MKNLFYFYDDYYLPIVISISFYKIDKVIMLREKGKSNLEDFYNFKEYIESEFKDIVVEDRVIKHYSDIKNIIKKYDGESFAYFDGEANLNEFVLFDNAKEMNIKRLLISESKGIMYEFDKNEIFEHDIKKIDLNIKDLINSFGGSIAIDQSSIYNSDAVNEFLNWIIKNYGNFKKINKIVFKRNNIFINDKKTPNISTILKNKINDYEEYILMDLINLLKEKKYLDYKIIRNKIFINYHDIGLKELMKKPGTWLEALIFRTLKEMKIFNDIKTSVEFLWDDNSNVRNELDVLAIKDQLLMCISCKDTKRYGKEAFNEIEVYSQKIGGDSALRVIITTEEPEFKDDLKRAEEMNINVIIFTGDINELQKKVEMILWKKN